MSRKIHHIHWFVIRSAQKWHLLRITIKMCVRQRKVSYRRNFSSFRTVGFNLELRPPCRYSAHPNMYVRHSNYECRPLRFAVGESAVPEFREAHRIACEWVSPINRHTLFIIFPNESTSTVTPFGSFTFFFLTFSLILRLVHYSSSFCSSLPTLPPFKWIIHHWRID